MFDTNSRYYKIDDTSMTVKDSDGNERRIVYKRRRFVPSTEGTTTLVEHTVIQGERLDNITARYLGDPTLFWRVCDANLILNPDELTAESGSLIKIALPLM
jgi:hypothetical protein